MKTCTDDCKRNLRLLRGRLAALCLLLLVCAQVQAQTVEYIHTDALGSPIAVTDASQNVIERSEYAPYGDLLNRPDTDGPGFTGHVQDAATGLTYMQQRYYDPLGMFLSVDPVTAYDNPVTNFCRYCYARNNPYGFKDPDGRRSVGEFFGGYPSGQKNPYEKPANVNDSGLGTVLAAGPIIGGGLALGGLGAGAAIANPITANNLAIGALDLAAGDAIGGASLASGVAATGVLAAKTLSTEGKALLAAQPVASALKSDAMHRAATFMKQEAAEFGTHTKLVGGDGVTRTLTQMLGGFNGKAGRYEYIVEQGGDMTHQRFVPDGAINGVPNKP